MHSASGTTYHWEVLAGVASAGFCSAGGLHGVLFVFHWEGCFCLPFLAFSALQRVGHSGPFLDPLAVVAAPATSAFSSSILRKTLGFLSNGWPKRRRHFWVRIRSGSDRRPSRRCKRP